jgi:hypothetical protein
MMVAPSEARPRRRATMTRPSTGNGYSRPETAGGERPVSGIESRPLRSLSGGLLVTAVAVRGAGGQLTVKAVRLPAALRH